MKVSQATMDKYRKQMSAISSKCADEVLAYMQKRKFIIDNDFVRYAHALSTKYGEAAAALSCQMYDELASASVKANKVIAPAEPAPVATYSETAKTVYGTAKKSMTEIPSAVGLLAKRAGEDTTLNNALRDGAEFAWIPSGDTCAFCRMLASNGWRTVSKKTLRNGHAEHIHANCDCTYAVRFDANTNYEGYDPEALYEDYKEYGLRGMERKIYAENKTAINARRREAYAKRNGTLVKTNNSPPTNVLGQVIKFDERLAPTVKQIIENLAREYDTRLYQVVIGADKAAGTVDVGGTMRLSTKLSEVPIHEFAHSIATYDMQKLGLTDYEEFWKEIKKLQRRYRKEVGDDSSRWISAYEHANRTVDEFLAEGFAHAKMQEWGMEIPERYGNLEVSKEVLKIVDKYFKKKS